MMDEFEEPVTNLEVGDIVRRVRGWTPLAVTDVRGIHVEAAYCGETFGTDYVNLEVYMRQDLILVVDPHKELAKCGQHSMTPGWLPRLNDEQLNQLQKQVENHKHFNSSNGKGTEMTAKLYQTVGEDTPRFGTYLATNTLGQIVLEMKGANAAPEAFDKDAIEEVLPWTFQARNLFAQNEHFSFTARKDSVAKGDMLLGSMGVVEVIQVNTKSRKHQGAFTGRKILTEAIEALPEDVIED